MISWNSFYRIENNFVWFTCIKDLRPRASNGTSHTDASADSLFHKQEDKPGFVMKWLCCPAIIIAEADKKFRAYLLGINFIIVTDCSALTKTL